MKKYLIAITMMLALGLNTQAASQKHRHSSRTEQVDSTKNNQDAIEAFSDTTSTADADDAEDDKYITHRHRSVVYGGNEDLKEVMDGLGGILAPTMIFSIIAMVILFVLAPLILIIAIFYFVNKNRKERYKLAQMAIQNGQPIPDDILKERTDSSLKSSDYQTGMKQMFTGIGLAIFLGLAAGKWGFGIGALVFFIGLGKWFIARQSGNTGDDPLNNNNLNNQFNNKSNVSDL
ncbi:MAG: hypothetical protein J6Q22_03710 [Prevotella sp.]|jgi:hypothetical protein|nr:hypothetical protein [Prevotella sp.]